MRFSEIVKEARAWLQRDGRLTYRALKREFALDDEFLDDLREQLIDADRVAVEEDGRILVWVGDRATPPQSARSQPQPQAPSTYTPQHLAERIRAEQAAMESRGATDGERKTITALFADLKGSTALIEGLDPEDARAIIDPALQLMMDAVHRYEGYVAQALGDGIFALFGAPIAHEDHPQRALYAALRMQEEMGGYSDQVRLKHGIPLQMRVGINTGEVVVRSIRKDDLHTDYVPVGHSTNLAARMEQMANPGSIVISEYTRKLAEGYFDLKALGAAEIKGVDEPLNVYEVLGAGPLRTRLQVSARRGLSRFVGRHSELDQMQQALQQAKDGHGQIVGVMGEPGLGKSRLFYEFKLTSQSGCLVFEAFPVSHGKASPYLPVIELLKTYFQLEPTDDERSRKEKVTGRVLTLDRSLEDILPYLFALLGIADEQSSLQQMDAQIKRTRTFEALKKLLLRESLNQPLILIVEDLHWIDGETQGFLDALIESVASVQFLLLVNYRPEYRHEWGGKTYYTQLRLVPLGEAEADELLTFLLGADGGATGRSPLHALKQLILEKTEGTPFFMEEVVQALVEEGVLVGERGRYRVESSATDVHVPQTVQGILAARIDRLTPAEKALLQQLAVIGRQFPVSLVKAVVSQAEDELFPLLASLQAKEFLYEQPAFPESEYLFKHALTQDVAYGTVLHEQRKDLHERTGESMEALYRDSLQDHYNELAHHYSRSGNSEKAIEYLDLAGQQAAQRSANHEAVTLLTQAVALVEQRPATPEHIQKELTLQTALGPLLLATKGYAAQETEKAYTRAHALCQQVGEPAQLFPILWGLHQLYTMRVDYRRGQEYAEQMLTLAQGLPDASLMVWAYRALAEVAFQRGEFQAATAYCETRVPVADLQQRHAQTVVYGEDPATALLLFSSVGLHALGYPDRAWQKVRETLDLARELSRPFNLVVAFFVATWVSIYRREPAEAREHAEAMLALVAEQGYAYFAAVGSVYRGWALSAQGEGEAGQAEIRQGLTACQSMGAAEGRSHLLTSLAEAYGQSGQSEDGLTAVAEGLAFVDRTEERAQEAELHRLQGELILQKFKACPEPSRRIQGSKPVLSEVEGFNGEEEAEACFHKALAIAQHQEAKSWELRAVMSLARLWQQQGKVDEARELLAPVYNWFTEGFDTADLKDAKRLLEELR